MNPEHDVTTTEAALPATELTLTAAELEATQPANDAPTVDHGPPVTPHAMMTSDLVTKSIANALRRCGVEPQEVDDGVQEVRTRLLLQVTRTGMPQSLIHAAKIAATIAIHMCINETEKDKVHGETDQGLTDEPDGFLPLGRKVACDRLDTEREVRVLLEMMARGELPDRADEILDCVQAGMSAKETAEELGLTERAVKGRLQRMREKWARRLAALGMLTLMVLLGVVVVPMGGLGARPDDEDEKERGRLDVATVVVPADPVAIAGELRKRAVRECEEGWWQVCRNTLDRAAKLDPAGADDPDVRALASRAEGETMLDSGQIRAKPGR